MNSKKALIIVDLQNDFVPGGALAVKEGDKVVPIVNSLLTNDFDLKIATKDWHPANHGSFAENHHKNAGEVIDLYGLQQILWPAHCIQGTYGAEFVPGLEAAKFEKVFYKGIDKTIDSYSTFFDNGKRKSTGLHDYLQDRSIKELYFAGLATDYCVKFSVLDAIDLGYTTYVIVDACRGVNLEKNDSQRALNDMQAAGSHLIKSKDIMAI